MRIVNICENDFSNFAFCNAKALQAAGVDAVALKRKPHPFKYAEQGRVSTIFDMTEEIERADIVQFFHSDKRLFDILRQRMKNKRVIVYHTGTPYRSDPHGMNEFFNKYAEMCFTDQCEFMTLGAKNVHYIATAIDTDAIQVHTKEVKAPFVFAHYPSNPINKGTQKIKRMMAQFELDFRISERRVAYRQQLQRMGECDIYIELFAPQQNGNPYGCFGVTAFEAAALGKVVVTQNINQKVYEDVYGECPLFLANTGDEFVEIINNILTLTPQAVQDLQEKSRDWVVEKHSYVATGEFLRKILHI